MSTTTTTQEKIAAAEAAWHRVLPLLNQLAAEAHDNLERASTRLALAAQADAEQLRRVVRAARVAHRAAVDLRIARGRLLDELTREQLLIRQRSA